MDFLFLSWLWRRHACPHCEWMCINLAPEKWYVEADRKTVPPARRWFWRSSWFHHDIWSPWLAVMILLMSEDCNILSRSSLRAQLNDIPSRLERPTRPDGAKKKQTRYRHTQTRRITQTDRATEPRKIKQSLNSESNCVWFLTLLDLKSTPERHPWH